MASTPLDTQQPRYLPLKGSAIRLLSIKPGYPSEPIECGFVTISNLVEAPPYDALSYVWGKELNAEPILCNGAKTTITKQLADALQHLRRFPGWGSVIPWPENHPLHSGKNAWSRFARNRHEHRDSSSGAHEDLLWVDALCINQEDGDERAAQVKMMGHIYQRAHSVKVWFGKENGDPLNFVTLRDTKVSTLRMDTHLGTYGRTPIVLSFIAQALRNANGPTNRLAATRSTEDSAHRNAAYGFPQPTAPEWNIVREFFTNAWFERVWVVQEVVLASKATVLIGDWEIDWAAIGQAAVWFQLKGYAIPAVLKYHLRDQQDLLPVSKSASVWTLSIWTDNRIPLLELLQDFRTRLATNPVDKVYATFGLAEELYCMEEQGFHQLVEPNYTSKSVLEVYRDIARFLIIEHGNLAVLSYAGTSKPLSDWPSWVPDWRHDKASNALASERTANTYNASKDQPLAVGIGSNINALVLHGIEEDVVVAYGDRLASYGFGFVTYQEEIDFVRGAWGLYVQRPSTTSNSSRVNELDEIFIRTLTAGISNAEKPTSEDAGFVEDALYWFAQYVPKLPSRASLTQRLKWTLRRSPDSGRFHEAFVRACIDRRFFVTRNGLIGIGPDAMKEGDIVVLLFGGKVPYLLRPFGTCYKFLGECYIPSLMDGEAIDSWKKGRTKTTYFELI